MEKNLNGSGSFSVMFRSLQYRNYRLFFSGQGISLIGTWMQRIAMPWLVYNMTGSALLLGVVSFAGQIPTFLLSPVAGVLTDRWSRYRVLLISQIISMIQAFVLAWLCLSGLIQIFFGQWPWGRQIVNYFLVADSFFLITIALFIFLYRCECKK